MAGISKEAWGSGADTERDGVLSPVCPCCCHEPCRCSAPVQRSREVMLALASHARCWTRAPWEPFRAHVILGDAKTLDLRFSPSPCVRPCGIISPFLHSVYSVIRPSSYIAFTTKCSRPSTWIGVMAMSGCAS